MEYRYITKHGIGPGTIPKDVELIKWEDLPNYRTAIYVNRPLTTNELEAYDIYPEHIQESKILESIDDNDVEKLSQYDITNNELSILLELLNLIDSKDKVKAFELVDLLLLGKTIVTSEKIESVSESYTQKLLGNKI